MASKKFPNADHGKIPQRNVDLEKVEALARINCTQSEAAAVLKLTPTQFGVMLKKRPVQEAWARGRELMRVSVRRLQFRHAQMPNSAGVTMTKHLSAHLLGEFDPTMTINNNTQVNIVGQLLAEIDGTTRSLPSEQQRQALPPPAPNALPDQNPPAFGPGGADVMAELDALRQGLNGKKNGSNGGSHE